MIRPIPRYRAPIHYSNYYRRAPMKNKTVRRHNGVRVYRKNYWSKTTKHPQPERRKLQEHDPERIQRNGFTRSENLKKRLQERRKTWQEKRKSSKDR